MSGVLGLTKPRNGQRDLTGTAAHRLNAARERLIKAGRPVGLMTLAELEEEAVRWERQLEADRQSAEGEEQAAEERQREFMKAYRRAEPGDEIGPDRDGRWYRLTDTEDLIEIPAS
jgi:hypothetical protein